MKKSLAILATTAALTALLVSTPGVARSFAGFAGQGMERQLSNQGDQRLRHRRGFGNEHQHLLGLTSVLGLGNEQIVEIEAIYESKKEQIEEIKAAIKVARESLDELSRVETYNEAGVAVSAAKIGELVTEQVMLKSKIRFDVSAVLTAEQKAKLEEMRNAFSHRDQGIEE